jgi:hypothetical protein
MSALEEEEIPIQAAGRPPRVRWRRVGMILLAIFVTQYTITTLVVGLSVAGTLRYFVTPQIVAKFEALAVALKR